MDVKLLVGWAGCTAKECTSSEGVLRGLAGQVGLGKHLQERQRGLLPVRHRILMNVRSSLMTWAPTIQVLSIESRETLPQCLLRIEE